MFGLRELEQLLDPPAARCTLLNSELVVAYLRYGGCVDTCLSCLLRLPILPHRAALIVAHCDPPLTEAKVACIRLYVPQMDVAPRQSIEDLSYALRFSPEIAELALDALVAVAPRDDACVLGCVLRCLYRPYLASTRVAAVQALDYLCHDNTWLSPHVMALVELVPYSDAAIDVLRRVPSRAVHALPALVARGASCGKAVALVLSIAEHCPQEVVRQGGFTMLLLAGAPMQRSIMQQYDGEVEQPQGRHETLAYMHCRLRLPSNVNEVMADVMARQPSEIRVMFAHAYDLARDTADNQKPPMPTLPELDMSMEGAVRLVAADAEDESGTKVLIAPLARAAGFLAAHHRQGAGDVVAVPLQAKLVPCLIKALLYDELPCGGDDPEVLAALAELANMWCAPRLAYLAVDALTRCIGFYDVYDIAAGWPATHELLRYHAIEFFPCLAKDDRVQELADILWTCK